MWYACVCMFMCMQSMCTCVLCVHVCDYPEVETHITTSVSDIWFILALISFNWIAVQSKKYKAAYFPHSHIIIYIIRMNLYTEIMYNESSALYTTHANYDVHM